MTVSVLIVDDSSFFRKRLSEILGASGQITVVGTASNGREAVEQAEKLRPDVITMDYEMPVMDGITAVREILRKHPIPVLMFSSLTYEGARITLDALEAGAVDFLPKNFEEIAGNSSQLQKILVERVVSIARSRPGSAASIRARGPHVSTIETAADRAVAPTLQRRPLVDRPAAAAVASPERYQRRTPPRHYTVVAIGTSTGGPVALQNVLIGLPASFPAPLILVQHMPASFTQAFAERLNRSCQIQVRQAEDGDLLRPGLALLAPGGKQMMVENRGGQSRIRILPGDDRLNYKPSVDVTFGSLARSFPGKTLGIVLTGMGADGREGPHDETGGSIVWSQDEKSSVIYGMPMAVAKAGLSDEILALNDVCQRLKDGVS
ncbi:protein-glutamate methylesterase/protein-glutamine glutaminase [Marinobacter sp. LV10MA510-1]|uniref:protein-glutamate methylesterase/protein-glutamine glutaminase n=1 Tax=Marinobacter sp. LV10MA510-1 TaxID=1415567 RepID=UPI000BF946F0|nr:chemotaxis response regulator protein-glutamate methylesterase [Marinobacter sp. LV10MA510-1]PFG11837.1 two-component system chemotaxis response regulator CheB [Marinobacter sp. LV10MA510-1]